MKSVNLLCSLVPSFESKSLIFFLIGPCLTIDIEDILVFLVEAFESLIFLGIVVECFDARLKCIVTILVCCGVHEGLNKKLSSQI